MRASTLIASFLYSKRARGAWKEASEMRAPRANGTPQQAARAWRAARSAVMVLMVVTTAMISSCKSAARDEAPAHSERAAAPTVAAPARFAQTITGTTLSIDMVPLPGAASVSMSATEITWDAYSTFVFGLDEPQADAGAAHADGL